MEPRGSSRLKSIELGAVRTTHAPRIEVTKILPELATRARTTIRLHPRRLAEGETLAPGSSRMGGDFLWPADEPWTICPTHNLAWTGVLQLGKADFPEMPFKPGTDLLQVLWCPQYGHGGHPLPEPLPIVIWRDSATIAQPLDQIPQPRRLSQAGKRQQLNLRRATRWISQFETFPDRIRRELKRSGGMTNLPFQSWLPRWFAEMSAVTDDEFEAMRNAARRVSAELQERNRVPDYADDAFVPLPCRLFPERVTEYPQELSAEEESRLCAALAGKTGTSKGEWEAETPIDVYRCELSVADGTKLLGYVNWIQRPETPHCDNGHIMEHLLTIASSEWDAGTARRWRTVEEENLYEQLRSEGSQEAGSLVTPAGLMIGDVGCIYIFICRQCDSWPVKSIMQCT